MRRRLRISTLITFFFFFSLSLHCVSQLREIYIQSGDFAAHQNDNPREGSGSLNTGALWVNIRPWFELFKLRLPAPRLPVSPSAS